MSIVLCMSNGLSYDYINGINFFSVHKRSITLLSCEVYKIYWNLQLLSYTICQLFDDYICHQQLLTYATKQSLSATSVFMAS